MNALILVVAILALWFLAGCAVIVVLNVINLFGPRDKAYGLVGTEDRAAFVAAAQEYQAAAAAVVQTARTHRIAKEDQ